MISGITDCGKPQKIKDGKATPDNKVNTTVGATASIRCKPGFESDRKSITCLKTGKWEKATCSDIGLNFVFCNNMLHCIPCFFLFETKYCLMELKGPKQNKLTP
jgi:hypothetical protein